MINLRYHVVSLTAVFLAMGIGLTLGSTFLDRATVDNLNGQLENLDDRLRDRETEINRLRDELSVLVEEQDALDEQASGLLAGYLDDVEVVVMAARGVEEDHVQGAVGALVAAGADVQGIWWLTPRFVLDDQAEVADLARALEVESDDPSRLRRAAIDALAGELRARQLLTRDDAAEAPAGPDTPEQTPAAPGPADSASTTTAAETPDASPTPLEIVVALIDGGFVEFEATASGPERATFPDGARLVLVGGSTSLPDDLVLEPIVERMARATSTPFLGVVTSALEGPDRLSDVVSVVRGDENLRDLVPTVDDLEHFAGWAATVVALADVGDGVVGHYGTAEGATRLLPPMRTP